MEPPHASTRVHNPNYPQQPAAPASYASYGPASSQQPAVQQPPFDPFQKRDPFMPAHASDRRDSYPPPSSLWHGDSQPPRPVEVSRKDSLQAAPAPPPQSPFHAGPALFKDDHMRRRSLGGSSIHNASPVESSPHPRPPPPQQSSYLTRHMPPPGAQSQSNGSRSAMPTPPPASASSHGPPLFSSNRQNMSISSIMGNDTASNSRPPSGWSQHNSGAGPQAPHSPERSTQALPPYAHQSEHESHPQSFSPGRGDQHAHYAPHRIQNNTPPAYHQSGHLPPRPYSQPAESDAPLRDPRAGERHYRNGYGESATGAEFGRDGPHSRGVHGLRDRSSSDVLRGRGAYDGPPLRDLPPGPFYGPAPQDRQGPFQRSSWGSPVKQEDPRFGLVEYGPAPRPADDNAHSYMPLGPPANGHAYNGVYPRSDLAVNEHPQDMPRYGPEPRPLDAIPMQPSMSNDSYTGKPVILDASLRRSLEEGQMAHKSVLGGFQHDQRRMDRGSPLPQAVHGVSAQPLGIGRDPHVKIEFGRMFSGLGSGVGSTPQPSNQPWGRPSSPPDDDGEPRRRSLYDYDGFPRSGRRNKRRFDDDRLDSGDSADGRGSPLPAIRGGKKPRHPHHHHPLPPHHHHFPHRRPEDDAAYDAMRGNRGGTPLSRNPSLTGQPPLHHHHHHHHHPGHHHHHHAHRLAPQASAAQLRQPVVEIRTSPLLQSVADKPRKHLGSQLYATRVKQPSSLSTPLYSNHTYSLEPNKLPLFEGKENCTFTIRVPRKYLSAQAREKLLFQRRIWGTDVYTDDSDPICAAIHAGWMRGAWPDDVDELLLGLDLASPAVGPAKASTEASPLVLTSPPSDGPKAPPEGKDLKITILILPPLEKYASSTWHGVKSRAWGGDHDGMSFKIEKLEFVDLGTGSLPCEGGRSGDKAQQKRHMGLSALSCGIGLPISGSMRPKALQPSRIGRVGV